MNKKLQNIFFFRMTDFAYIFFLLWVIFNYPTNIFINADGDLFWHIKQGDWIFQNKSIYITKELFTFQFDYRPWIYVAWLGDLFFYILHLYSGFLGIFIFTLLFGVILYYALFRYSLKTSGSIIVAVVLNYLAFYLISSHWFARNHIFGLAFLPLWLILLENYYFNNKKKVLWVIPASLLVWEQMHGSFIYGIMVLGIYFIAVIFDYCIDRSSEKFEKMKTIIILTVVTGFVSLLNPYGIEFYIDLFTNTKMEFFKNIISDWAVPNSHKMYMLNIFMVVLSFMLFTARKKMETHHIILMLFFGYEAYYIGRNASIFGIVSVIVLSKILIIPTFTFKNGIPKKVLDYLKKTNDSIIVYERSKKWYVFAVTCALSLVIIFTIQPVKTMIENTSTFDRKYFNQGAVDYLKSRGLEKKGRFYNSFKTANTLIWSFYPEKVVFYDTRGSIYDLDTSMDYFNLKFYPKYFWDLLDEYKIKYLVFDKSSEIVLIDLLRLKKEQTKLIYEDDNSAIFEILKTTKMQEVVNEKNNKH